MCRLCLSIHSLISQGRKALIAASGCGLDSSMLFQLLMIFSPVSFCVSFAYIYYIYCMVLLFAMNIITALAGQIIDFSHIDVAVRGN